MKERGLLIVIGFLLGVIAILLVLLLVNISGNSLLHRAYAQDSAVAPSGEFVALTAQSTAGWSDIVAVVIKKQEKVFLCTYQVTTGSFPAPFRGGKTVGPGLRLVAMREVTQDVGLLEWNTDPYLPELLKTIKAAIEAREKALKENR